MFREERIMGAKLHGSGCILSAAIAAGLGKGMTLEDSVSGAKRFVWEAIRKAGVRLLLRPCRRVPEVQSSTFRLLVGKRQAKANSEP